MASHNLHNSETPEEVKNAKGLHLLTMSTPNGQQAQIMLEELKLKYGTDWTTTKIDIMTNEQKKEWYIRLNPNGRIPVLVDNTKSPPFVVHETKAILFYLLKEYDTEDAFGFKDEFERNEVIQWTSFGHGSLQPIMGQLNHFSKAAKEKIPYAIQRFHDETLRVFEVLEIRLSGKFTNEPREYLAGSGKGKYSIADIGVWPWVKAWKLSEQIEQGEMDKFPHLLKWIDRIAERPAVKTGTGDKYAKDKK